MQNMNQADPYIDKQSVREKANSIRNNYIESMEKHLINFDAKLIEKKFKVEWILSEEDLVSAIKKSLPSKSHNRVCFDIPEVPEKFFEKKNQIIEVSIDDNDNFSDLVVEADFGIVENGSLVLLNKRSGKFFNSVPNIHIILSINNLIEKTQDLETIIYLKYNSDFSEVKLPDDVRIIKSPFLQYESTDGFINPTEDVKAANIMVYLYDNGITEVMEDKKFRETLYCINCGRCKDVCPIYKIDPTYSPIEKLKNNIAFNYVDKEEIFRNTTLCGNCNEVCPVLIPFTELFIYQMQILRSQHESRKANNLARLFSKRSKMNKLNNRFRRCFFVNRYYRNNKKLMNYFLSQKDDFYNVYIMKQNEENNG